MKEYSERFPSAPLDAHGLAQNRVNHLRGKTYEEIYGKEGAKKLKEIRKASATKQFEDKNQRVWRFYKLKGRSVSKDIRKKLSKSRTVHGQTTYRKRAFEQYGLECKRCGLSSKREEDFIVHHKDFLNIPTKLGNHSIDNLEVLCKSCHMKLHNDIKRTTGKFLGISNIEKGVHLILKGLQDELGLDLSDTNFTDTPKRVARAYYEIFEGVKDTDTQVAEILASAFPGDEYDEIIMEPHILAYSMCPHHLLPVEYDICVAYLPAEKGKVLGCSKLARLAQVLAKRPVLQEKLTVDIATYLSSIDVRGAAVVVKGIHYCLRMRGVKSQSIYETSCLKGVFKEDQKTRMEFFDLLKLNYSK